LTRQHKGQEAKLPTKLCQSASRLIIYHRCCVVYSMYYTYQMVNCLRREIWPNVHHESGCCCTDAVFISRVFVNSLADYVAMQFCQVHSGTNEVLLLLESESTLALQITLYSTEI